MSILRPYANVQIVTGRELRYLLEGRPEKAKVGRCINTPNLLPLIGLTILRDLIARGAPGTGGGYAPTHWAFGSGTTPAALTDQLLGAENYRDEITVRAGTASANSAAARFQIYLSLAQGNGLTFSEAGMFDNSLPNTGNMLARTTFTPIAKSGSIEIVGTWTIFFLQS